MKENGVKGVWDERVTRALGRMGLVRLRRRLRLEESILHKGSFYRETSSMVVTLGLVK